MLFVGECVCTFIIATGNMRASTNFMFFFLDSTARAISRIGSIVALMYRLNNNTCHCVIAHRACVHVSVCGVCCLFAFFSSCTRISCIRCLLFKFHSIEQVYKRCTQRSLIQIDRATFIFYWFLSLSSLCGAFFCLILYFVYLLSFSLILFCSLNKKCVE